MPSLTLNQAEIICEAAMAEGDKRGLKPLTIAIFDGKGALRLFKQPDPSNITRPDMAMGKAYGAFAFGQPSRQLAARYKNNNAGIDSLNLKAGGKIVPVIGGILIRDEAGEIIGTVGASGDKSESDEACAIVGVKAAGLIPDPFEPEGD
jgi:uncharacterized protein GlcG (DUF336 family)